MLQRSGPSHGRDAVPLTPFLLLTILAALVSTAVLMVLWYIDTHTPPTDEPSAHDANLIVAVGFTSVAWASVVFALCRDAILRRIDELGDQVARTAAELVEQAEQSGVFRGMTIAEEETTPHGRVLRYPARRTQRTGTEHD